MTKIKCKKCDAWLFSAAGEIDIEIHCKKCKYINRFKMRIVPVKHIYGKITASIDDFKKACPKVSIDELRRFVQGQVNENK